ncbi:MAG: VWA domain-containing protein [Acetobacteraceae bacterium]|nr:VWA domain-containing protein [Acetobacteraceae bacterium]
MPIGRRHLLAGSTALSLFGAPALAQPAAAPPGGREALLIPGKRSLRQRVLTRPGAAYRAQPGGPAGAAPPSPLTPLYVFARQAGPDGKQWLEVGATSRGATLGWLGEEQSIPWLHTMTAAFHNPAGRERTLFFRDRDSLLAMLGGATPVAEAHQLAAAAQRTPRPADFPVVALEPAEHIDIKRQFYLLPILQAESVSLQDGREYRMLEVASIPLADDGPAQQAPFSVGIAFVVDTTLSMDPYINKVRAALSEFVRATAAEPGAPTRYALVGFRNNLTRQPRLEYLNRIFARFADSTDAEGFIRKIADIKATTVDSLSYNEDSFAAIAEAIDALDWGDIQGRVIILVTDAGSLAANDPLSGTHMGPGELGNKARAAGIALMVLHLRTPQGASNHGFAERQYTALTAVPLPTLGPQYFPVPNGDPEALDRTVRDMLGKLRAVRTDQAAAQASRTPPNPQDRAAMVGYALRLAWLGRQDRAAAPDVVRAWAADGYKGTNPPECLEVRVLLSRNQLNDLAQSLRFIIDQGRANLLDSNAMFDRLQTVAAHLARDPEALRQRGLESLGGILGEYLDGLPYVSDIATLDRATWRNMGGGAQTELLDTLESRLRLYQDFNRTPELWKSFDGGRDAGEAVYPVPLSALP